MTRRRVFSGRKRMGQRAVEVRPFSRELDSRVAVPLTSFYVLRFAKPEQLRPTKPKRAGLRFSE
jgi:hypothetical protein